MLNGKASRAITKCRKSSSFITPNPILSNIFPNIISGPIVLILELFKMEKTCSTIESFSEINNFGWFDNLSISCFAKYIKVGSKNSFFNYF